MLAHKMMERFTKQDWNYLIKVFSKKDMKKLLYEENRDNIVKMMIKIISNKPRLVVKYLKYFPFSELKNYKF